MKITFIENACAIFSAHDFNIVSDPWLIDGAFYGSWCHYPPVKTTPEDLVTKTDALYISHAHPDHYDELTLSRYPREIPIYIADQPPNILVRLLGRLGFSNVTVCPENQSVNIGPFKCRFFGGFDSHHMETADLDNILDSAMLLECGGYSVMNFNDNIPSLDTCKSLRDEFGKWSAVMVQYCGASPYPSCYDNLSEKEKLDAQEALRARYLDHFVSIGKILEPDILLPFAGQFVIGGKHWTKNPTLGTLSQDAAADHAQNAGLKTELFCEGRTLNLATGEMEGPEVPPFNEADCLRHIEDNLSGLRYPFHSDPIPDESNLEVLLPLAREHLSRMQERFDCWPDCRVAIETIGKLFVFDMAVDDGGAFIAKDDTPDAPYLRMKTDPKLLLRNLDGRYHWNNSIVGCHVNFYREPEVYLPDVFTLLSYLHVPRQSPHWVGS